MAIESLLQSLRPGTQAALDAAGYSAGSGPFVAPQAQMPQAETPDLTNRLLQIMSGQLGSTLTGGEKLSALGALLKSVSRGSQTSPQQVLQGIQQQKMQEVQGALQIQELRKRAMQEAQLNALKAEYVRNAKDPQEARELQLMSAEDFSGFLRDRRKPQNDVYLERLSTLGKLRQENPALADAYEALISPPVMQGSFETGIYSVPRPIPQFNVDPALVAEMQRRRKNG